ncbi:UvrD-helicase domain-containing protein [Herbivorax sp. ANBcel31]|uniref:UvrD-helicase domain-containing protein n=1 Tax=Herbivorax sp. ANBcel31 TaxID=3069754 RepID=UPI0027B5B9DD|nr:UvrD-helicase domain-containing protein [Herbivorax sp. ANBcel31]MDQ2088047.1 UvrD-helicase domain-containing protein [Herbivorax sp. ANBcel31]
MILTKISPNNKEKENNLIKSIYRSIDKNESIFFNSGAGSGKTYALIECLRYVIDKYGDNLKQHNQKIICITYTNIAAKEVKSRLGNSEIVLVSTIHDRIWQLIKFYQKELVEIHKEKLNEEITNLEEELETEYDIYQSLDDEKKENLKIIMIENKELFYQNYNSSAMDFRNVFMAILESYPDILKNISIFKKMVGRIYKIENYRECLENIISNKEECKVEYNSTYNRDQLHKMRISHDTLLEYGFKIIKRYNLLKKIIIDKYPFVFIDEYQDTSEKVVSIMSCLQEYSKNINHKFFIGYFGDVVQNIYDDGIGEKIKESCCNLKEIKKDFNRRSTKEVIDVINNIRNDQIKQESIYNDCTGGSVGFYTGSIKDIDSFIKKYETKWNINCQNKLHCLVLTNEIVARYSGFENIYNAFKETDRYRIHYDQLNTELLNTNDLSKLGEVPNILFKIVELYNNLINQKVSISEIVPECMWNMNIIDLRELIKLLKQNKGNTLEQYVESISKKYLKVDEKRYKDIIDRTFDLNNFSFQNFKNFLIEKLFPDLEDDKINRANEKIQKLLDINMDEYNLWYKHILCKQEDSIIYHTYHGTKGLEFDNVSIIMGNSFGRKNNYFKFFFEKYNNSKTLKDEEKKYFEQIRNLLYVSCSRARKHLRILYIDEVASFKDGIEKIFGKVQPFRS